MHFAKDAGEANAIVSHLARSRGVKVATKSKSMVSEELELNHVLESIGVDVYETDLGEYIIQLAGEAPSHLVAPALHKSKEDVAELFRDKLGVAYDEDIIRMAATARRGPCGTSSWRPTWESAAPTSWWQRRERW